jgi:hypothetical protein
VAQLYLQPLGSIFVASYDSQGYSGGMNQGLGAMPLEVHDQRFILNNIKISVRTSQETQYASATNISLLCSLRKNIALRDILNRCISYVECRTQSCISLDFTRHIDGHTAHSTAVDKNILRHKQYKRGQALHSSVYSGRLLSLFEMVSNSHSIT